MKITTNKSEYFAHFDCEIPDSGAVWIFQLTEELKYYLSKFLELETDSEDDCSYLLGPRLNLNALRIPAVLFAGLVDEQLDDLDDGTGFIHADEVEMEWLIETYGGNNPTLVFCTEGSFAIETNQGLPAAPLMIAWFYDFCFGSEN